MAKPTSVDRQTEYDTLDPEDVARAVSGQIVLLALPIDTFNQLNAEAIKRGITTADLLSTALDKYLAETNPERQPQLAPVHSIKEDS